MINIIITSYSEPNATSKAIDCFLNQNIKQEFKITIIDPFSETETFLKKKYKKEFDKNKIGFFLDPGEGKSYALNVFLERIYSLLKAFEDEKVGCVTGKPVLLNPREKLWGYISHVAFAGIHKTRLKLSEQEKFFECSGYLFAIRNGVLQGFPLESSEDSIIPYLFNKQKYKIKYAPGAEVYVINPQNWKDFKLQKIRNIKAHENLNKIAPDMPRTKSLTNEIKQGALFALIYPRNVREVFFTIPLFSTRLYIYLKAFYEMKFKKQKYSDGWRKQETKSTRSLD